MSKWHKIVIRDPTLSGKLNPVEMLEFLGKSNNRRKVTRRRVEVEVNQGGWLSIFPIEYCFKFKDEKDAFTFKLRWT